MSPVLQPEDITPRGCARPTALRDFDRFYVRFGSEAAEIIGTVQRPMSALPLKADITILRRFVRLGRVEDRRGSLGHLATLRFPSSLIEPDVPISGIRLSDWFHREAHGATARGKCSRRSRPSSL